MRHSLIILFLISRSVFSAEEKVEELTPVPEPVESIQETVIEKNIEESEKPSTLSVSARFDTNYSGGGSVHQGFSIPSARISVEGIAGRDIQYRFSAGQTREYSTALLPQLLPTEAYFSLHQASLSLKVGLFSPQFNPWWTPDLSEVNFPDYHETQKALYLSREMGVELQYSFVPDSLQVSIGYVNGSGVFTLNTNNAKAGVASIQSKIPLGEHSLRLGTSGYIFSQSTSGAINYRSNSLWTVYAEVSLLPVLFRVEGFLSHFEDSTKIILPEGGACSLHFKFGKGLSLFGRYEYASNSPISLGRIQHLEGGPILSFSKQLDGYFTYSSLESGGQSEDLILIRFRLSV